MEAVVYTDGSGTAKREAGGIGYVGHVDGVAVEGSLSLTSATNQQAEILAVAYALHQLEPCDRVVVWSDSKYVVKGMTEWLPGWQRDGWRTSAGRPVMNRNYWERLLLAAARHTAVEFQWCRGHAGNELNERADVLAGEARAQAMARD